VLNLTQNLKQHFLNRVISITVDMIK